MTQHSIETIIETLKKAQNEIYQNKMIDGMQKAIDMLNQEICDLVCWKLKDDLNPYEALMITEKTILDYIELDAEQNLNEAKRKHIFELIKAGRSHSTFSEFNSKITHIKEIK